MTSYALMLKGETPPEVLRAVAGVGRMWSDRPARAGSDLISIVQVDASSGEEAVRILREAVDGLPVFVDPDFARDFPDAPPLAA